MLNEWKPLETILNDGSLKKVCLLPYCPQNVIQDYVDVKYHAAIATKLMKLNTRNMATEYSQPGLFSSLRWNGKHTPERYDSSGCN